jgi:hypothetical protein
LDNDAVVIVDDGVATAPRRAHHLVVVAAAGIVDVARISAASLCGALMALVSLCRRQALRCAEACAKRVRDISTRSFAASASAEVRAARRGARMDCD